MELIILYAVSFIIKLIIYLVLFRGCSNVERVPEAVISSGIHVVVSPCD